MNCHACGKSDCGESSLEVCQLKVALRWALEHVEDDLSLDHQAAKEHAELISKPVLDNGK